MFRLAAEFIDKILSGEKTWFNPSSKDISVYQDGFLLLKRKSNNVFVLKFVDNDSQLVSATEDLQIDIGHEVGIKEVTVFQGIKMERD